MRLWYRFDIVNIDWLQITFINVGLTCQIVLGWDSFFLFTHHHHHHHVVLVARISLTLSRHFSLSFIPSGRSSGQYPVSSHSCWMYVRAGRPAFAWPCVGVHKSTSLMSSSLLLQQCPACLVRLTWIVFVIGSKWPYILCLNFNLVLFLRAENYFDEKFCKIHIHFLRWGYLL